MKPHNPEYEQKSVMFPQAEANFQGDTQEDFKSLVQETDPHDYLYEPEYSKDDQKCIEEQEGEVEEAAAAADILIEKPSLSVRTRSPSCLMLE